MFKKIFIFFLFTLILINFTPINAKNDTDISLADYHNYLGTVEFDINETGTKTFISTEGELIEITCEEESYSTFSNAGLTVTRKRYTVSKGAISFTFRISTKATQYDEETWYTYFTDVEALDVSGFQVVTQNLGDSIIQKYETATSPARAEAYGDYSLVPVGMSTIGVIIKIKNATVDLDAYGS